MARRTRRGRFQAVDWITRDVVANLRAKTEHGALKEMEKVASDFPQVRMLVRFTGANHQQAYLDYEWIPGLGRLSC